MMPWSSRGKQPPAPPPRELVDSAKETLRDLAKYRALRDGARLKAADCTDPHDALAWLRAADEWTSLCQTLSRHLHPSYPMVPRMSDIAHPWNSAVEAAEAELKAEGVSP